MKNKKAGDLKQSQSASEGSNAIIRVMIVDDHQIIIDGLKSAIAETNNLRVVAEANNGKEAIDILNKTNIDVVLMDIDMPIMNGCDATQIITSGFHNTRVIALTTFNEKAIIRKMLNAGASGYLLKNIKKETLIEAIHAVHQGRPYFSSEISLSLLKPSPHLSLSDPSHQKVKPQQKHPSSDNTLSGREIEILKLIAGGLSNIEIGKQLFISHNTVKAHRENIMRKLDVHNVTGLVRYAFDNGLME